MQNQHPRLPVSFLSLHTNRRKPGSRSARVLPGVGEGSPPQRPAAWSFQASPTQKTPLSGALGVCILLVTHQPGDCGAFQRHRELQVQEGIVAGPSLPAPAAPALSSLVSRPARAPGVDISPASEPSWQHSTADNSLLGFLSSPYSLGVLLIYRVVSVSECWAAHLHIHTPVLSWVLSWDRSGPASTGTVSLLQEVLVDCLFYSQEFM